MGRDETLKRVEEEIRRGQLGIARDRLQGLITTYPLDLELRSRLGDVYWQLGYPVLAGQFWFLTPGTSRETQVALKAFLKDCVEDPAVILKRLRLHAGPESLHDSVARERLEELARAFTRKYGAAPPYPISAKDVSNLPTGYDWVAAGCVGIAIVIFLLAAVGLGTVINLF